jgi:prepilin-type N-terminal cleavage/methylation domain-containing protein/prepilin-type processing-associated H-X9-DG protein
MSMLQRRKSLYRGFTLIELLVVISIVSLLIAILLPALSKAKLSATNLRCMTNQRSIGQVTFMFVNDHRYMPYSSFDNGRWTVANMLMGAHEKEMGCKNWNLTVPQDWCPDIYNSTNYLQGSKNGFIYQCPGQEYYFPAKDQNATYGINGTYLSGSGWGDKYEKVPPAKAYPDTWFKHSSNAYMTCSENRYASIDAGRAYTTGGASTASRIASVHPNRTANFLYMDGHVQSHQAPEGSANYTAMPFWHDWE